METISKRIDNVTLIPAEFRREVVPPVKAVKVELVGRCQLRCGMCSLPGRETQPKQDMEWGLFTSIVDEMVEKGIPELGAFYIGDSTLNPALLKKALKYAKNRGIEYTFLTTNGVAMTPFLFGEIAPYLDSLKFSVNAADEEQWREITRTKPALWNTALENLKGCFEERNRGGFKTRIYASSILYDGEQRDRMEKLLAERVRPYSDEAYFLPLYDEMQSPQADKNRERGWRPNAGNPGRVGALRDALPCWAIFREAHVRVTGEVSLCCFGSDDRWDCGTVQRDGLMGAWNSRIAQELRRKHLAGDVHNSPCERCIHG